MMLTKGRLIRGAALASLGAGFLLGGGAAEANVLDCDYADGTVRAQDLATNHCYLLRSNIPDYRSWGGNDYLDQFGNDDWTRGRAMCFYQDINYRGQRARLPVGYVFTWSNIVSSSLWTTASTCP